MNLRLSSLLFIGVFAGSFFLASCLNDDNKIPPNCYDGILNNGEQLTDCGGPCEECNHCLDGIWQPQLGEICIDCGGECGACSQCSNCIQDGDESGIDCGGTFCGPCLALCDDGVLNGNEEEVDCGGACEQCPTCTDFMMNGTEIGIDCGGVECLPCSTDGNCLNLLLDGDEFWVDCGGSNCPGCDTILTFKINGATHTVIADNVTFSFNGSSLNIGGVSLQGGSIGITMDEPPAGWVSGATVSMNQSTFPAKQISFMDAFGTAYSSGTSPSSSGTVNLVKMVFLPSPGFVRGSFAGTLYNAGGAASVSLSSGLFQTPLN